MKILKHGKQKDKKILRGTCDECGCEVECDASETNTLIDRDTKAGTATQFVVCPECGHPYLWVN